MVTGLGDDRRVIDGRFFVTPHAVRGYLSRFRRDLVRLDAEEAYRIALADLIRLTSAGRLVGPAHGGAELWRGPRLGTSKHQDRRSRMRFIVGPAEGHDCAVVTVLPVGR